MAGLTSYYAARDVEKNPLVDIRENIRPDLRPAPVYGQGGFDLGFRGYAEGGEVLDMRDGGESEGLELELQTIYQLCYLMVSLL